MIDPQAYRQLTRDGYSAIAAYITVGAKPASVTLDNITEERWRRLPSPELSTGRRSEQ